MNQYVTGNMIKKIRESRHLTQLELAEMLQVSDKTISKWETGKGYPDISLIEPLARALQISVIELLSGEHIINGNRHFNMLRQKWYVCPICGNIITSTGDAVMSCCGLQLPALEAEEADEDHVLTVNKDEDEFYVSIEHPMTKTHYISFVAAVSDDGWQMTKLYPEGQAEARFKAKRVRMIYFYCNKHGLFVKRVKK